MWIPNPLQALLLHTKQACVSMAVYAWMCISIGVKQLCLFQLKQMHGGLQDAAMAKGEPGGGDE